MYRSNRFVSVLRIDDKADAALRRALRDGDDVEAIIAQRAEDAARNAGGVPHARAYDGDDDDILQCGHIVDILLLQFAAEFILQGGNDC